MTLARFDIYHDNDTGEWVLEYDGDVVAADPEYEVIARDFQAFMGLDAAIGSASNTYIASTTDDRNVEI